MSTASRDHPLVTTVIQGAAAGPRQRHALRPTADETGRFPLQMKSDVPATYQFIVFIRYHSTPLPLPSRGFRFTHMSAENLFDRNF